MALPVRLTDDDAERLIDETDQSEYDLSGFKPRGLPHQRYICETLERAVAAIVRARGRSTLTSEGVV